MPPQAWYARLPVPAIFEEIESNGPGWLDDISARYDPVTGVPMRVSFRAKDSRLFLPHL